MPNPRGPTRLLAVGNLLLLLLLGGLIRGVGPISPIQNQQTPDRGIGFDPHEPQFELATVESYAEIARRPLFEETRRQPIRGPIKPPDADKEVEPPDISVSGIILAGTVRLGLVHDHQTDAQHRLMEGRPLPGSQGAWRLTRVEPRGLIFQEPGGRTARFDLAMQH